MNQIKNCSQYEKISLPKMIEFSEPDAEFNLIATDQEINSWNWNLNYSYIEAGYKAFNGATDIAPFFHFIKKAYEIDTIIETGTFKAFTTLFFSNNFNEVHTIEINSDYYKKAQSILQNRSNVHQYLGNSKNILKDILPSLKPKRLLFYLDAHWYDDWPLLDELDLISSTHKNNCIIAIDDIKVPGRSDINYDKYKGIDCSYEYIKESLNKCFTEYDCHYLIPKEVNKAAKFVAIPKKMSLE